MFAQKRTLALATALLAVASHPAAAQTDCADLPNHAALSQSLKDSVKAAAGPSNGGLDLNMWASTVNRAGEVCAVTRTGQDPGDQWPGSRVISAQKANTANAFSLPGLALSTANLWAATQPGGSLYGLQHSNPVNPEVAYAGDWQHYGTAEDPLVGNKPGGVNVFGGGLALYDSQGNLLGALGVSGDTSCADHNVAWRVREALELGNVPGGVQPENNNDGIIYDIGDDGESDSGFGHPTCGGSEQQVANEIGSGG